MSEGESHHHGKNEIIIVKRHKGDHDGAHGGAWKIAYADFMTAMMAFFLIMWLVNAANEETKAAVASYFNPIKLTSEVPPEEGLLDPKKTKQKEQDKEGAQADKVSTESKDNASSQSEDPGKETTTPAPDQVKSSEADYFENPYAVIAEIAQETQDKANISLKGEGGAKDAGPGTGADGGKAFKDPFDPDFWTQQVEVSRTTSANNSDNPEETVGLPGDGAIEGADNANTVFTGENDKGDKKSGEQDAGDLKSGEGITDKNGLTEADALDPGAKETKADKTAKSDKDKNGKTDKDKNGKTDKDKNGKSDKDKNAIADKDKNGKTDKDKIAAADKNKDGVLSKAEKQQAAAEEQAAQLQAELKKELGGKVGYLAEGLIVTPAEGGMLISISDQVKTPMFRLGSSIPTRETVLAMEQIAKLLKTRKGQVAIRGHTDSRPYKNKAYDNWRLSTDRAQSAYYMLLRGGLDEKRISQVSGFADHRLQDTKNPLDESNRRIEILLQADAG